VPSAGSKVEVQFVADLLDVNVRQDIVGAKELLSG